MIEISKIVKKEETLAKGMNPVGIDHDGTPEPNVIFMVTIIILPNHVLFSFKILVFLLEKKLFNHFNFRSSTFIQHYFSLSLLFESWSIMTS